ncbi:Uncharacterized protein HZ326_28554, partial [Fusarium oxysporum f. sp. albedinis]
MSFDRVSSRALPL